jgi:probable HAF family extracellular repeat protein
MQDLGTFGHSSFAKDVSGGNVVGGSQFGQAQNFVSHAFLWTAADGMQDLGTLGGCCSSAAAVSGGNVVGESLTSAGSTHAFLWTAAGGMQDLGTLLAPPLNVTASDTGTFGAVDVKWDLSPTPGIAYELLYGTASRQYTASIPISDTAVTSYHVTGLENGVTYFFAVRLIGAGGSESVPSNEASATPSTDTSDYERALVDLAEAQALLAKARGHGLTFDFDGEVGLRMAIEVRTTVLDVVAAAAARAGATDRRVQDAFAALSRADSAIGAGDYANAVKELREAFKQANAVL